MAWKTNQKMLLIASRSIHVIGDAEDVRYPITRIECDARRVVWSSGVQIVGVMVVFR